MATPALMTAGSASRPASSGPKGHQTGLGIEAQHLFLLQIRQGFFPVFQTAHQMDGPFVMAQGQGVDFVAAQAATQTFQIHAVRGVVS